MTVLGIQPVSNGRGYTINTETAATVFGLLAGVAGGVAQIVAGRNLAGLSTDRVRLRSLGVPLALGAAGSIAGALLVPGGD